ncbi:cytochrome C [Campylobacter sp. MIT 12-8780]|uniref:c-type cytochrome n=1 Tax=unclassified Campylobacter TaxID=2593542 RepID=UPI00115CC5E4|nr:MULTISPECIES: c-type cytochrome [unclassified Campylobacter]NDJ27588.1 cytochrome c1 [Campylobacter sp. MIT 19-121]TQR40759.1 cytochrome C [Campylobacter sp. MIT 12-8780]
MREFKIFLVVACFTALVYWGVEPYAHSVLKPHTTPANFNFEQEDISFAELVLAQKEADLKNAQNELEKAKKDLSLNLSFEELQAKLVLDENESSLLTLKAAYDKQNSAQNAADKAKLSLEQNKALWGEVAKIDFAKGDSSKGAEIFMSNCIACHGLKTAGIEGAITDSALGVIPPDLSSAGVIYDEKFLAALILNPALALKVDHKFPDGTFLMTAYNAETTGEQAEVINANIADLIAYLKDTAKQYQTEFEAKASEEINAKYAKLEDLTEGEKTALIAKELSFAKDKNMFIESCGRCHDMRYDSFASPSKKEDLKGYLGSIPPDLSMMIRSRGDEYLHNFINNTQKLLPGTAMPRVGLNEATQTQVVSYLEKVGDSKKEERESLGIYIMIFFAILSVFAVLWKRKVWENLH